MKIGAIRLFAAAWVALGAALLLAALAHCAPQPGPPPEPPAASRVAVYPAAGRVKFSTSNDAGVVMVATTTTRQAFVWDVQTNQGDGTADIGYTCWLTAPAAYIHPLPSVASTQPTTPCRIPPATTVSWGYTSAELGQIQNGNIVEACSRSGYQPVGTTLGQIETFLQNQCGAAQQRLIALAPSSGTHVVGLNFDSALNDGGGGWNAAP